MKKISILLLLAATTFYSCKKEKIETVENPISPGYSSNMYHFPISIGDYWIYESITLDSNYNVLSTSGIDSVYIARDTAINGKTYFIKERTSIVSGGYDFIIPTGIERDSSGYHVNQYGGYLKHDDFTNVLNSYTNTGPPAYTRVAKMADKDSIVTIPAGTFKTINLKDKISFTDPLWTGQRIKYNNMLLAETAGMIFRNVHFASGTTSIGIRLIRYHVEI